MFEIVPAEKVTDHDALNPDKLPIESMIGRIMMNRKKVRTVAPVVPFISVLIR